jgi:mannosyl-oligosaccharide alpha-1,2-mannosidase
MIIMGLDEEAEKAINWVKNDFNIFTGYNFIKDEFILFVGNMGVSLFESVIRILAGLISAYDLTGDRTFLRKAEQVLYVINFYFFFLL